LIEEDAGGPSAGRLRVRHELVKLLLGAGRLAAQQLFASATAFLNARRDAGEKSEG
jgi:hypothetical protein